VDVRIVAATNRDLASAVRERLFRSDLLFRLDVIRIQIPPLRERPDDVDGLVDALLDPLGARLGRTIAGVTDDALGWLRTRPWPGNVRELANVLERAVALGEHDTITLDDLAGAGSAPEPPDGWGTLDEAASSGRPLAEIELAYIRRVVEACGGNMSAAARRLGIDRRTLYRRIAGRADEG
jgi:DNA-binding NtrC family response regulator